MAENSKIEWTDATWNPTVGCSVLSPGCTNCYAMRLAGRLELMGSAIYRGHTTKTKVGYVWNGKVGASNHGQMIKPFSWKRPRRVFVNSMSDLFHEDMPEDVIDRVFAVMALCPQHTFQVLTKRSARMLQYMTERWQPTTAQRIDFGDGNVLDIPAGTSGETRHDQVIQACEEFVQEFKLADQNNEDHWVDGSLKATRFAWPLPNVWLGVSVEDQKRADERIPDLMATPAAIRFLSCEPLLGPLSLTREWGAYQDGNDSPIRKRWLNGIDWIIAGGESGPGHRSMETDWARSLRDQCAEAGVAFFMKQMAGKAAIPADLLLREFPVWAVERSAGL